MKLKILLMIFLILLLLVSGCSNGKPPELITGTCRIEGKSYSCNDFQIGEKLFEKDGVEAFKITYKSEGLKISGLLARPKNISGKAPLMIFNHGGIHGIRMAHTEWIKMFAKEGYVVLASTYRGEDDLTGKSEGNVELAQGEVTDVLNLLKCGKTLDYVNDSKIGMVGFSHGAGITMQAIEISNEITAAAEFYGLNDARTHYQRYFSESITGGEDDERLDVFDQFQEMDEDKRTIELEKRTPLLCVDKVKPPLLIIHGEADKNIPISEAHLLKAEMEKYGKEYEMKTYPGAGHGFNFKPSSNSTDAWKKAKDWFGRHLKNN